MNETSPYILDEPPTSTGRALLSRAFLHWCALHYGYAPTEVASALDLDAPSDPHVRRSVRRAARLIGELIAAGEMKTFSRPMGGGVPAGLSPDDWELDDFRPRFAASALDPTRPFDLNAAPTHWIFVELDGFNRIVDASCADVPRPSYREVSVEGTTCTADAPAMQPHQVGGGRLVRLPEVEHLTGMSRATIYRRIDEGRFPKQVPMKGNIAAWAENDVATWLSNPR